VINGLIWPQVRDQRRHCCRYWVIEIYGALKNKRSNLWRDFLKVEGDLTLGDSVVKAGRVLTLGGNFLSVEMVLALWRNLLNARSALTLSGEWFDESIVLFNIEGSVMFAKEVGK
jgi:hypothetical protein